MRLSRLLLLALLLVPSAGWGQDGVPRKSFKAHTAAVERIAFRPGGKQLLTVSGKEVVLWDAATGTRIREFKGHTKAVQALAFSGDGKTLTTWGYPSHVPPAHAVVVWDLSNLPATKK